MFKIRREQREVFARASAMGFERRLFAHLSAHFPALLAGAGDRVIEALIHHGVERAAAHGITTERGAAAYVHAMLLFGRDFDIDPRQAWAQTILDSHPPGERGEALLRAALARTSGTEGA